MGEVGITLAVALTCMFSGLRSFSIEVYSIRFTNWHNVLPLTTFYCTWLRQYIIIYDTKIIKMLIAASKPITVAFHLNPMLLYVHILTRISREQPSDF